MYHTRSSLYNSNASTKKPAIIRGSSLAAPSLLTLYGTGLPCDAKKLTTTSSTISEDELVIERTSSGSQFFRRKRSDEEQKTVSRARAQDLSKRLETSNSWDLELNNKANFRKEVRNAPTLSHGNLLQAVAINAEKENEESLKARGKIDPLKTDREVMDEKIKNAVKEHTRIKTHKYVVQAYGAEIDNFC